MYIAAAETSCLLLALLNMLLSIVLWAPAQNVRCIRAALASQLASNELLIRLLGL